MKTLLAKSFRLGRFQMLIVIIVTAVLSRVMLNYFARLESEVEEFTFRNNLQTIQQRLEIAALFNQAKCTKLSDPSFFEQDISASRSVDNKWSYDPQQKTLTYLVSGSTYFRSDLGQKINIQFVCSDDKILIKVSPYTWCRKKGIFGCKTW